MTTHQRAFVGVPQRAGVTQMCKAVGQDGGLARHGDSHRHFGTITVAPPIRS